MLVTYYTIHETHITVNHLLTVLLSIRIKHSDLDTYTDQWCHCRRQRPAVETFGTKNSG